MKIFILLFIYLYLNAGTLFINNLNFINNIEITNTNNVNNINNENLINDKIENKIIFSRFELEEIFNKAKKDLPYILSKVPNYELNENNITEYLNLVDGYLDFNKNKPNKTFNSYFFKNLKKNINGEDIINNFLISNILNNPNDIKSKLKNSDQIVYIEISEYLLDFSDKEEIKKYIYNIFIHELTHSIGGSELLAKEVQEYGAKIYSNEFKLHVSRLLLKQYQPSLKNIYNNIQLLQNKYPNIVETLTKDINKDSEFLFALNTEEFYLEDNYLKESVYYKLFSDRKYDIGSLPKTDYYVNILSDYQVLNSKFIKDNNIFNVTNEFSKSSSSGIVWIIECLVKEKYSKNEIISFINDYMNCPNILHKNEILKSKIIKFINKNLILDSLYEVLEKKYFI